MALCGRQLRAGSEPTSTQPHSECSKCFSLTFRLPTFHHAHLRRHAAMHRGEYGEETRKNEGQQEIEMEAVTSLMQVKLADLHALLREGRSARLHVPTQQDRT